MLIGHEAQINFLKQSWQAGRLAQAYIFAGPEGVGKRAAVRELVGWVLGKMPAEDLSAEMSLLYVERAYDPKTDKKHKDITVKDIDRVRDYLRHHSFLTGYRLAVINEAEFLNDEASNALLKSLEEPAPSCSIILLVNDEERLLSTVASRCQLVRFQPVPVKKIYEALVAGGANRDMAQTVSRLANHLPGEAVRWQEEDNQKIYQEEAERFFNLYRGDLYSKLKSVESWFGKTDDHSDHIETRDRLVKVLRLWLSLWRDFLLCRNQAAELAQNTNFLEKISLLAQRHTNRQLIGLIKSTERAMALLRQNIHPRLLVENIIINI